jgi:predicted membrane protein
MVMKGSMKAMKQDWLQSRPLLYFLFLLYIIAVSTFFYRQDTPSLIVFYLLFLLFFLISKNMIVVLGSTLFAMLVLVLLRQSVKEGLTQPDEPTTVSKKIPEDPDDKKDAYELTFNDLEKNLNDINRIEDETRKKLNALKELHSKGPAKPVGTPANASAAKPAGTPSNPPAAKPAGTPANAPKA